MDYDLKILKKHYGENFSHLARELFPSLLEQEGLLSKLIEEHFAHNKFLYEDIVGNNMEEDFKNYIYSFIDKESKVVESDKTPKELLDEAGYILYECKSEEDIQSFKKYYASGEELCTFNGGRLNVCHVFFAVKKNVEEIKRKNFTKPQRQDEYGTSVISIQFTKGDNNIVSIKNRYNHTVNNPDATFSNNLDNIIPGLTDSFNKAYNFAIKNEEFEFELPNYMIANDDKWYKYNYEIDDVYYCIDNIIIEHFNVVDKYTAKERYILMDYFILDMKEKTLSPFESTYTSVFDPFADSFRHIDSIDVKKEEDGSRIITLKNEKEEAIITIDKQNRIIGYKNLGLKKMEHSFLRYNRILQTLEVPNVQTIDSYCLCFNEKLKTLDLPNVTIIENAFLLSNEIIENLNLPKVKTIGDSFLEYNRCLKSVSFPKLKSVGDSFFRYNKVLEVFEAPNLEKVDSFFLLYNLGLRKCNFPKLIKTGRRFLFNNREMSEFYALNLETIGDDALYSNNDLKNLYLPKVETIGDYFLHNNEELISFEAPKLMSVGTEFMSQNIYLRTLNTPKLNKIGNYFLSHNLYLEECTLGENPEIGHGFLNSHPTLGEYDFKGGKNR